MSHFSNDTATQIIADAVDTEVSAVPATKDAGRVKVGGVGIRFKTATPSTKDAGRVQVGGVGIRFKAASASTKDTGRVRVGGVGIRF